MYKLLENSNKHNFASQCAVKSKDTSFLSSQHKVSKFAMKPNWSGGTLREVCDTRSHILSYLTPSPILASSSGSTLSTVCDVSALVSLCLGIHWFNSNLNKVMVALNTWNYNYGTQDNKLLTL